MKSLYTYIEEARQYAKFPMSYEEFEKFVLAYSRDTDEAEEMAVEHGIPADMVWPLFGYIDGSHVGEITEEDIKLMYDELQRIPLERLPRILGAGSEGSVIAISDDKVIKWFHKHNAVSKPEEMLKLYRYILEHPHKNFPKIYKVTEKYVVLERLETKSSLIKQYDLKYSAEESIKKAVYYGKPMPKDIPAKILNWHVECCKYLKDGGFDYTYPGDLRTKNMGVRPKTKEVVWFDL